MSRLTDTSPLGTIPCKIRRSVHLSNVLRVQQGVPKVHVLCHLLGQAAIVRPGGVTVPEEDIV